MGKHTSVQTCVTWRQREVIVGNILKSHSKPLLLAVSCLWIEALAIVVLTVVGVVSLLKGADQSATAAIALSVLLLIFAAGIAGAGYFMLCGYRTARSFGVTWQIFQSAIGIWMCFNGLVAWGIPILIITILAFRFLFAAETIAATNKAVSR
ncbi:hypothetical protein JT358_14555 [Micrococcales bacterium 31B]|nr:hypothetical protein [Micrococcales bacterium 31B]